MSATINDALKGVGVIFDLDGTLVDTAGDLAASMNHALAIEGHKPLPVAAVRHLVGHGAKAMIAKGLALSGVDRPTDEEMEHHRRNFLDHYRAHIADHSRPFDGALAAIEDLSAAGAVLAICTNKHEEPARQLIGTLRLDRYFPVIVGGDTASAPKPDPAPVRLCLERLGVERAIFIGDSDTDIAAAANTGLTCLLHTKGYGPLTKADTVFACFDDYSLMFALTLKALAAAGEGRGL